MWIHGAPYSREVNNESAEKPKLFTFPFARPTQAREKVFPISPSNVINQPRPNLCVLLVRRDVPIVEDAVDKV
jgi:hypothetical protein